VIPAIIHRVVIGPEPALAKRFWDRARVLHPDWTFVTHTDTSEVWDSADLFPLCMNTAEKADLIRFEALGRYGGFYLDWDVEMLRPLDSLRGLQFVAGWQDAEFIAGGVLGSVPGHPANAAIVAATREHISKRVPGAPFVAHPALWTEALRARGDVTLLPPGAFYPYHWTEPKRKDERFAETQPWAFGAHHWWASWKDERKPKSAPREPRVVILVPWRGGDPERERLWEWTRAWWERKYPEWPIYVGVQEDDEPFNAAATRNKAAALAGDWDVAIVLDADAICETAREAVAEAWATQSYTLAFTRAIRLTPEETEIVMSGGPYPERKGPVGPIESMCVVLPRSVWDTVGGYDERFVGWGAEDNAMLVATTCLVGRHHTVPGEVWHLHHTPAADSDRGDGPWRPIETLKANRALFDIYARAQGYPDAMRALIKGDTEGALAILGVDKPKWANLHEYTGGRVPSPNTADYLRAQRWMRQGREWTS
jgi:hypothetical protein